MRHIGFSARGLHKEQERTWWLVRCKEGRGRRDHLVGKTIAGSGVEDVVVKHPSVKVHDLLPHPLLHRPERMSRVCSRQSGGEGDRAGEGVDLETGDFLFIQHTARRERYLPEMPRIRSLAASCSASSSPPC